MDSKSIIELYPDFSDWMLFTKELVPNLPTDKGSYVFRTAGGNSISRVKGESDILYIGSAAKKHDIRNRLGFYFNPSKKSSTGNRINSYLWKNQMEVSYIIETQPGDVEQKLIHQYQNEHSELPPFNHQTIKHTGIFSVARDSIYALTRRLRNS